MAPQIRCRTSFLTLSVKGCWETIVESTWSISASPVGEFVVNEGPPRALRNAAGAGIPFPYVRTVGNGASVSSREQSVRRRECTLFPAVHERGYYQRETECW